VVSRYGATIAVGIRICSTGQNPFIINASMAMKQAGGRSSGENSRNQPPKATSTAITLLGNPRSLCGASRFPRLLKRQGKAVVRRPAPMHYMARQLESGAT